MAIYLKKFENHTQYENYINGSSAILPNVSICTTEGDVHYNPYVEPPETRLVAKFNVTSTSDPTTLASNTSNYSAIEIDGIAQPSVVSTYTFDTLGEHTVKYTLKLPSTIGSFNWRTNLTSIYIPNSVTSIGDSYFNTCRSLTSCTIGSSVTSIGISAFQNCSGLTSIDIPNSVTTIGQSAFQSCSGLTSCTIGSGVTSIGDGAFEGCSGLTSVTVNAISPPSATSSTFYGNYPIYVPSGSVDSYKSSWGVYESRIQPIP